MIDTTGLKKSDILAALYNAAKPQGMGFLQYKPEPMTSEQAQEILDQSPGNLYFDYLKGRVMKIDLGPDEVDPRLYNRDNGLGAAELIIQSLRDFMDPNNELIEEFHRIGVQEGARYTRDLVSKPSEADKVLSDGTLVFHVGLDDAKESLTEALDKVELS